MLFWKRVFMKISQKWYPRSVIIGDPVETKELAQRIARESTVSPADVYAVIHSLPVVMGEFMKESRSVHLEGFGWFRYVLLASGKGVDNKEDVSSDQITGLRVRFTPERERTADGTYRRELVADGISYAEWLGRPEDVTEEPDEDDTEEPGGNEDGPQVQ